MTDNSEDKFQGCNHYGITIGESTGLNGVPKTKKIKTGMDEVYVMFYKCDGCGYDNVMSEHVYCPKCGKMFVN